jgi:hypothetical protein
MGLTVGWVGGVEDEGRDTGSMDNIQLREEIEGLGPGHAAHVFPNCQGCSAR